MIIPRYLAREILITLLVVITVLMLALLSQQMVRYLGYAAVGKIPADVLLEWIGFEIPYLFAVLLPFALYLGIMIAYGRLYSDNEMSILQMCGFSIQRVTLLTFTIALFIASLILIFMLWVNPWISAQRQALMTSDKATVQLVQTLMPGRFQVSPDGKHVLFVEKLSRDHLRAENVFLAQEKKGAATTSSDVKFWSLVVADQGYQMKDKETQDQFFVTTDGSRYEGRPGQNDYKITQFRKYSVRIPQSDLRSSRVEDEAIPTTELLKNYQYPRQAAELQWRFSIAISACLLALLAVPLSTVRPRQGKFLILLPAVIIYIIYTNFLYIVRHWVEDSILPISMGMWWVHGITFLFVMLMMSIYFRKQR